MCLQPVFCAELFQQNFQFFSVAKKKKKQKKKKKKKKKKKNKKQANSVILHGQVFVMNIIV